MTDNAVSPERPTPKKVVYLLGAGATQAEADFLGARPINLLMRDTEQLEGVSTGILKKLGGRWEALLGGKKGMDVEKLISLMGAAGLSDLADSAEKMRQSYFTEIRARLHEAQIINEPTLANALFELHADDPFRANAEELSGVITTNHDGLLQIASQNTFHGVNLGFKFDSKKFDCVEKEDPARPVPPILHLHGSFTWKFGVPISVAPLTQKSRYYKDTIWIPPSILKEAKHFPFNKLIGMAYELLCKRCDVLRVIGASMTQNDWNILSLIFNAQQHRAEEGLPAFSIELIMPPDRGRLLSSECSYLMNMLSIEFLSDGHFDVYKQDSNTFTEEMKNSFAYWLKQKIQHHRSTIGAFGPATRRVVGEEVV